MTGNQPTLADIEREAALLECAVDTSGGFLTITRRSEPHVPIYASLQPLSNGQVLAEAWDRLQRLRTSLAEGDRLRSTRAAPVPGPRRARPRLFWGAVSMQLALLALLPWLAQQGDSSPAQVRIAISGCCLLAALACLLYRRGLTRRFGFLFPLVDSPPRSRAAAWGFAASLFLALALCDGIMLALSVATPGPHTAPLQRNMDLGLFTASGLTWLVWCLLFPTKIRTDLPDYGLNCLLGGVWLCMAWLIMPAADAAIVSALTAAWLVLMRRCRWIPRYRSPKKGADPREPM